MSKGGAVMNRLKFSALLIELRKEKDLTQQDFAEIFNVTFQAVSKWETGESLPDITTLEKISEFYQISINDLLNGERENAVKVVEEVITQKETKPSYNICISKIIFSSCALVIYLLLGLIPFVKVSFKYNIYINANFYQIAFSSDMVYGNVMFLLSFFVFVAACAFGICSGVFQEKKVLYKLEQLFALYNALTLLVYLFLYLGEAAAGYYVLTIYCLAYFLVVLLVKQFNKTPLKENPDMLLWIRTTFAVLLFFFTIYWIISPAMHSNTNAYPIVCAVSTIALIICLIVSFFKKNTVINILFITSFAITIGGYLIIALFTENSSSLVDAIASLVISISYIAFEIVFYKASKAKLKEEKDIALQ